MKGKLIAAVALTGLSGVALACALKAMPPFVINVSAWDLAVATVQGYDNPARAAAMKNLDSAGQAAVGATNWVANNYVGPVTYRVTDSGATIVTEDKACGEKAIDSVSRSEEQGTAATGGGGGYYWYGGGIYGSAGTCLYGCRTGVVTVGETKPV